MRLMKSKLLQEMWKGWKQGEIRTFFIPYSKTIPTPTVALDIVFDVLSPRPHFSTLRCFLFCARTRLDFAILEAISLSASEL